MNLWMDDMLLIVLNDKYFCPQNYHKTLWYLTLIHIYWAMNFEKHSALTFQCWKFSIRELIYHLYRRARGRRRRSDLLSLAGQTSPVISSKCWWCGELAQKFHIMLHKMTDNFQKLKLSFQYRNLQKWNEWIWTHTPFKFECVCIQARAHHSSIAVYIYTCSMLYKHISASLMRFV